MTYALITEGVSEYRIIKYLLEKYFKDQAPTINQVQPKLLNDKQETPGGWHEVLKYCERTELKDILTYNDFLVIQIDTDQSQTSPFSISHTKAGSSAKSSLELYEEVVQKLQSLIKPEILESYRERIIFAICIHSIECWLLPLVYSGKHASDILNCLTKLNAQLRKRNMNIVSPKTKNDSKSQTAYKEAMSGWKRKSDIVKSAKHNVGFKKFVEALETIPS